MARSLATSASPRPDADRIALVGFMGSGKSTIGPLVASALSFRFIDVDDEIEQRTGASIRDLFRTRGEAAFRQVETETLAEILEIGETVVATGGGVAERERNRELLKSCCVTFFLHVSFAEALRRVAGDRQRPLLENPRPLLEARYRHRQVAYAACGETVHVDDVPASRVAGVIVARVLELNA